MSVALARILAEAEPEMQRLQAQYEAQKDAAPEADVLAVIAEIEGFMLDGLDRVRDAVIRENRHVPNIATMAKSLVTARIEEIRGTADQARAQLRQRMEIEASIAAEIEAALQEAEA